MNNLINILEIIPEGGNCDCLIQPIVVMAKIVYGVIYVVVPIGLIIMGMIDFAKAMMASDDSAAKKAQGMFIKRAVAGVAVFLVLTFVNITFTIIDNQISKNKDPNTKGAMDWVSCWQKPGKLQTKDEDGNIHKYCNQTIPNIESPGSTGGSEITGNNGSSTDTPDDQNDDEYDEPDSEDIIDHEE